MNDRVEQAVSGGLHFLFEQQLPDGEFPAYVSPDERMAQDCELDSTPFVTAMVVYSLGFVPGEKAQALKHKALRFLRAEMEGPGLWRYWTSKNPKHRLIPIDLDDTCCASFALAQNGEPFPSNVDILLANRNQQGLFYTWLLPRRRLLLRPAAWWAMRWEILLFPLRRQFWQLAEATPGDVDCVVNANTLLYLGENEMTRPVVEELRRCIVDQQEADCDKWYLKALSFYYMLSRAYFNGVVGVGPTRSAIVERLARVAHDDGGFGNALDTALAVCSLLNLDGPAPLIEAAIARLMAQQGDNGAWPSHPLYWGGPKKVYGWGSEALTTALCVEALAHYRA